MLTNKKLFTTLFAMIISAGLVTAQTAAAAETFYNVDKMGVAIKGYDPVAYFTMSKPVMGKMGFDGMYKGATWKFSSVQNRDMFLNNPEKYAPLYGGYCAYGVAVGALYDIDPRAWTVHEGRLYLNKNLSVRKLWTKDIPGYIAKADVNWPGLSGDSGMMDDTGNMK